jgi:peptidoglycan/xylan/chitin deacetylase (PgdA/CDA1 family)
MMLNRRFLFKFLNLSGLNILFRFLNRKKAIILWYHGICDDTFRLLNGFDERHIQKSNFRKQLIFLKKNGYIFLTMTELTDIFRYKKKINKMVVITFDDGYSNVVTNAYPIMKEVNAKGCFYLVSDLINSNKLLWTDYIETVVRNSPIGDFKFVFKEKTIHYLLDNKKSFEDAIQDIKSKLKTLPNIQRINHLRQFANKELTDVPKEFFFANWNQIQSLDKKILEIGCHTKRHPNLTSLGSIKEFEEEIKNSKIEIEKKIGYQINHFCYPLGDYNQDIINKVKECGYKSAVTIKHGFNNANTDVYQLKRIEAPEDFLFFKSSISGSFLFLYRIKEFLFRRWKFNNSKL